MFDSEIKICIEKGLHGFDGLLLVGMNRFLCVAKAGLDNGAIGPQEKKKSHILRIK